MIFSGKKAIAERGLARIASKSVTGVAFTDVPSPGIFKMAEIPAGEGFKNFFQGEVQILRQ
jgi:hypothetical protein